jgi:hypothetical protein
MAGWTASSASIVGHQVAQPHQTGIGFFVELVLQAVARAAYSAGAGVVDCSRRYRSMIDTHGSKKTSGYAENSGGKGSHSDNLEHIFTLLTNLLDKEEKIILV